MNEDFHEKNIELPFPKEIKQTQRVVERERVSKERIYRPIVGARVSEDFGKSWKIHALCGICVKRFEPPTRVKNEGVAATQACDWCGALNEMFRK